MLKQIIPGIKKVKEDDHNYYFKLKKNFSYGKQIEGVLFPDKGSGPLSEGKSAAKKSKIANAKKSLP